MNNLLETTVGSIVAQDYRTSTVFTSHGIDFCCKGGQSLAEACARRGLDLATVEEELRRAMGTAAPSTDDPATWTLTALIEHIERVHHRYVAERMPVLAQYVDKLARVHGERHPELLDLSAEFHACIAALTAHMKKEELVLFPYVAQLEKAHGHGVPPPRPHFGTVANPIRMMEHEHVGEGERFERIKAITQGYTVPPDGCATWSVTMDLLREFEADLHRHIHLENNILFPRALAMEAQLNAPRTA